MRRVPSSTDRRLRAGRVVAVGLLAGAVWGPIANAAGSKSTPDVVPVMVDNAKLIRLPDNTQTVVVGNPLIADVSLQKNGVVILTGKSFGTTNLIALDPTGTMIAESLIRVEAPQTANITVQRGMERESYSCTPRCQPTAELGDSTKWFSEVSSQADRRRSLAAGGAGASGQAAR